MQRVTFLLAALAGVGACYSLGRRAALGAAVAIPARRAFAEDGTLGALRKYTALAPLGSSSARIGSPKRTGLALDEVARILAHDVAFGAHGEGGYFISGDLTPEIFEDDCTFRDPTNEVSSLAKYTRALQILFDPIASRVMLLAPPVVDSSARTLTARVRSAGVLQLPWRPRVPPYTSEIVWQIDSDGLVASQSQVWSISALGALKETFTPGFGSARASADGTLSW